MLTQTQLKIINLIISIEENVSIFLIVITAWSACYDEGSGFTYYWNQTSNAVTWEAPPEYLLALKLAQQQLHTSGTTYLNI